LARQGNNADALKVFAAFDEALPRHPLIVEAVNEINGGKKPPPIVDTPQAGAPGRLYRLRPPPRPPGGGGPRPLHLPPAPPLSPAGASARPALARGPLRGDEETRARQ